MSNNHNHTFWIDDPYILFNKKYVLNFIPSSSYNFNQNLNALTRLLIILAFIGFIFTQSEKILISFFVSLVIVILYHRIKSDNSNKHSKSIEPFSQNFISPQDNKVKQQFTVPTKKNPMMNVLLNEINDNPKRKPALPSYAPKVEKQINEKTKDNLDPRLFKSLGDNLVFDQSMRNFHTMPNTQIPNDQKAFAEFCYGNMSSCKDGDGLQCVKNNYRHIRR